LNNFSGPGGTVEANMAFTTTSTGWGLSSVRRLNLRKLAILTSRLVLLGFAVLWAGIGLPAARAQSNASQPATGQGQQDTQQPAQQPGQDIPDAPSTAQPPPPPSKLPPVSGPDIAPADPNAKHADNPGQQPASDQTSFGEDIQPRPKMPPIKTLPPGTSPRNQVNPKDDLFKLVVGVNFVQVPVMVKDRQGRRVDGLLPSDFTILENGKKQALTFFTSDPYELSVAIVLDMGLPDVIIQRINETYTALVGAFSPYDEVALYTYSSTVSQVADFTGSQRRLTSTFDQVKTERGANNGVPVLNGPMASGPTVNGVPVGGPPIQSVNTPPRESHVLNDAILQAAVDLAKRDRTRRKVIFVISDGREFGSSARYSDVVRILQKNEIQIKAVALDTAELPLYSKIGRLHVPLQGRNDLLPRYTSATGGGQPLKEFSRNAIEAAYQQLTSEARNQYTLGYSPHAAPGKLPYREIEVQVDLPDLKIYAKDRYYPVPSMRLAPQATTPPVATPPVNPPAAAPAPAIPAQQTPPPSQ
jgi:VWFA-related protein